MAITILPKEEGFGGRLGTALGTGLSDTLSGLAQGKLRQMQAQQFQSMGLPPQLAYLPEKVQSSMLKQLFAAQEMSQRQPQIQESLAKLQELERDGDIGDRSYFNPLRYIEGKKTAATDLANLTAQQLKKVLPKGEYVPADYAKMEPSARKEYLAQLEQKYGASKPQGQMIGEQQQVMPSQVQQFPQGQQQSIGGPLGAILRTLGGAATQVPAALVSGIPKAGAPLSAGIIGSDVLSALEPEHTYEATQEQLQQLTPAQKEMREAIEKTTQEKGGLKDYLPSTANIKKLVGKMIPDNLITPKSKEEKFIADSVAKGVNLMSFGKMGFPKALAGTASGMILGRPLGQYAAKKTVGEDSNWSPLVETVTESLFTMAPGLLWNNARAVVNNDATSLYEKFDDSAAARQQINVKEIYDKSKALRAEAQKFESLKSNKQLIKTLEDFEEQAVTGKMKLSEAVHSKRELYRNIQDSNLDKTATGKLKNFTSELRKTILDEGARVQKEGAEGFTYLKKADEIRTGLANSETIVDKLKAAVKRNKPQSLYLRTLIGRYPEATVAGIAAQGIGIPFAKAAVPIAAVKELGQFYKFFKDTPGAWEELSKIALEELKGNSKAAAARLASLDRKALKDEKKQSRFLTQR